LDSFGQRGYGTVTKLLKEASVISWLGRERERGA